MKLSNLFAYLILVALSQVITSCDNQKTKRFDGVYDAYPFNSCRCDYDVYLLINNGHMQIYGPHGILHEAGKIEEDRWKIWPNHELILKRFPNSLTMQTVGEDSFYELPVLPMTKNEFDKLDVHKTEGVDEFVAFHTKPFEHTSGSDRYWKLARKLGYGPRFRIEPYFQSTVQAVGNTVNITVSSVADIPIKAVFDPTNFYGRVVIVRATNKPEILEIEPYSDTPLPELITIEPGDAFNYSINLELDLHLDYNLEKGNSIITELHIEMPHTRIISEPVMME